MKLRKNKQTDEIQRLHARGPALPLKLDLYGRLKHALEMEIEEKIIGCPHEFNIEFDPYEGKWVASGRHFFYAPHLPGMCISKAWHVKFEDEELAFSVDVLNKIKDAYDEAVAHVNRAWDAVKAEFKEEIVAKVLG